MRFDRLLWECLEPGAYEAEESDIGAILAPEMGETILLFKIDTAEFRERRAGVRVCDLLFFTRKSDGMPPTLLFVELKGSDYQHGEEQLETAVRRVVASLHERCIDPGGRVTPEAAGEDLNLVHRSGGLVIKTVLILASAAPSDHKQRQKEFYRRTGLPLCYRAGARRQRTNLRPLLEGRTGA